MQGQIDSKVLFQRDKAHCNSDESAQSESTTSSNQDPTPADFVSLEAAFAFGAQRGKSVAGLLERFDVPWLDQVLKAQHAISRTEIAEVKK